MSYSVNQKCGQCKKYLICADGLIIRNAVQGIIHMIPSSVHRGYGAVHHECHAFEDKDAAPQA